METGNGALLYGNPQLHGGLNCRIRDCYNHSAAGGPIRIQIDAQLKWPVECFFAGDSEDVYREGVAASSLRLTEIHPGWVQNSAGSYSQ